jgi:energy-coupling factor transport system permease protein
LRLAVILVCVGAANVLTSPRRLLKSLPSALYEVGVAVTVALSFAPQSVAAVARLRTARRLRGRPHTGIRSLRGLAVPVLEGALDRSVDLAAAMDARGFGRRAQLAPSTRRLVGALTATGLVLLVASTYALLVPGSPALLGLPLLAVGAVATATAFGLGARRGGRTRYRPDPWGSAEWAVTASGLAAVVAVVATGWTALTPSTSPPELPSVPLGAVLGIALAALPAWFAPPLPRLVDPAGKTVGRPSPAVGALS